MSRLTKPSKVGSKKTFGGTDTASGRDLKAVMPIHTAGSSIISMATTAKVARTIRRARGRAPTLSTLVETVTGVFGAEELLTIRLPAPC